MTMQSRSEQDDLALIDAIEAWAEKELRPVARQFDLADEYPHEIVEQMKQLGLFGATIGEQYGGLGLSAWTYAQIVTKVASVWMAPSGIFNSHLIMASAIERYGTEEQKQKYLPRMATGESIPTVSAALLLRIRRSRRYGWASCGRFRSCCAWP